MHGKACEALTEHPNISAEAVLCNSYILKLCHDMTDLGCEYCSGTRTDERSVSGLYTVKSSADVPDTLQACCTSRNFRRI